MIFGIELAFSPVREQQLAAFSRGSQQQSVLSNLFILSVRGGLLPLENLTRWSALIGLSLLYPLPPQRVSERFFLLGRFRFLEIQRLLYGECIEC